MSVKRVGSLIALLALFAGFSLAQWNRAAAQEVTDAPPKDVYAPPQGNAVEDWVFFLADLLTYEPGTKAQLEEYRRRAPQLMNDAAHRILQLETDKKSDNYLFAEKYLLAYEAMMVGQATPAKKQELFMRIKDVIYQEKMDYDDLDIAVAFAEGLEMAGDKKLAGQAYEQFSQILKRVDDPVVSEMSMLMAGAARRLNLVGARMNVTGMTLDGEPFDWNAYRGKVVLVDFWASWCGPCRAELPNLQALYEKYHPRGFEVVGICLDEEREAVDSYLRETSLPWVTLYESDGATNETAVYYGINALPASFLVDPQGTVVALDARGQELEQRLQQLLGTP